jgi:hypothetical protein
MYCNFDAQRCVEVRVPRLLLIPHTGEDACCACAENLHHDEQRRTLHLRGKTARLHLRLPLFFEICKCGELDGHVLLCRTLRTNGTTCDDNIPCTCSARVGGDRRWQRGGTMQRHFNPLRPCGRRQQNCTKTHFCIRQLCTNFCLFCTFHCSSSPHREANRLFSQCEPPENLLIASGSH